MKVMEKLKKFWNETLGPDYPDGESAELKIDSTDPVVAELARSQKHVEDEENNYGNSGKAQRKEILEATKVDPKVLKKNGKHSKVAGKQEPEKESADREIGE